MIRFYDPTKLLNSVDRNGEKPELLLSISNRGAGKTYGFAKYLLNRFIYNSEQFALLCRWQRELGSVASGIFKAVLQNEFPGVEIIEDVKQKGVYATLTMRIGESKDICGYVLPINGSDNLKKVSSEFANVQVMFFDEFMCDAYCPNEVEKFVNVHFTVARGNADGVRFVPVILASNSLSIMNPYFSALGLSTKIQSDTKFYKGEGLVLERFVNKDVAAKQRGSAFNRAFSNSKQVESNIDNSWLNDSWACICKPKNWGRGEYHYTLTDGDVSYGVRYYPNVDYYYISRSIDETCPAIFNISKDSMEETPQIKLGYRYMSLRRSFERGKLRFSDIITKSAITELF